MPVASQISELLNTPENAMLGPQPRPGVLTERQLFSKLDPLLGASSLPSQQQELVRSLLLLWHDHLDASHNISQGIENADGSFVHATMHRREPDYWNSKYWWRRVGNHPAFGEIAGRTGELLKQRGVDRLAAKLLPGDKWDAYAFVDACEQAGTDNSSSQAKLLREIQRIEFEVLLERFTKGGD